MKELRQKTDQKADSWTHTSPADCPLSQERPQISWTGWRWSRSHTADRLPFHTSLSPLPGKCTGHWRMRNSPRWPDHWSRTQGRPEVIKENGATHTKLLQALFSAWLPSFTFIKFCCWLVLVWVSRVNLPFTWVFPFNVTFNTFNTSGRQILYLVSTTVIQ